jgi:hypothetical protein
MEGVMKVSVGERIRLLAMLPDVGSILTLKIVRDLRGELSFSEKEHEELNLQSFGDRITWDDNAPQKDIEFGPQALEIITTKLKELNDSEQLTVADVTVWDPRLLWRGGNIGSSYHPLRTAEQTIEEFIGVHPEAAEQLSS